jgi:hypothetical protein
MEKPICGFAGMNDLAAKALFGCKAKKVYPFGENSIAVAKPMPKGFESPKWHKNHEGDERPEIKRLMAEGLTLKEAYRQAHAIICLKNGDVSTMAEGLENADKMMRQAKKCKL